MNTTPVQHRLVSMGRAVEASVIDCLPLLSRPRSTWLKRGVGERSEIVTNVDVEIERSLRASLLRTAPGAGFVGEEESTRQAELQRDVCFVVDPIDGTEQFVRGSADFGISVAVYLNGVPSIGVVVLPEYRARFVGLLGIGAYLNGERLPPLKTARGGISFAVSPRLAAEHGSELQTRVPSAQFRSVHTAVRKLTGVAAGEFGAAFFPPSGRDGGAYRLWDVAASGVVLTETGGWLFSFSGGNVLDRPELVGVDGWIAGHPSVVYDLLERLRGVETDPGDAAGATRDPDSR
jgi:myo-inositol-1(or 4)-monophosphatase